MFFAGCDKPGVPGEKGLQSTSIRNHSSGEETFSVVVFVESTLKILASCTKKHIVPRNEKESP